MWNQHRTYSMQFVCVCGCVCVLCMFVCGVHACDPETKCHASRWHTQHITAK